MAIIKKDANGNDIYITDPNGNEISQNGKRKAALLLILVTLLATLSIIAIWPDKLPPSDSTKTTKYCFKLFHVTYMGEVGISTEDTTGFSLPRNIWKPVAKSGNLAKDSTDSANRATQVVQAVQQAIAADTTKLQNSKTRAKCCKCTIDLNTLLLILVALAGFLGNMIHISASFTNFVGAGKFKRSWMLWYFVKPFNAAALAVGVYIIFRAGFLNSGEAVASVNLYGVVALAILAGLYTDMATLKLKEVFAVIFQSSTIRPDPLNYPPVKISDTEPNPLPLNEKTKLVLTGVGFADRRFTVKINGEEVKGVSIRPNALVFEYEATSKDPELVLYDEKNVEVLKYIITTKEANTPTNPDPPTPPPATAPTVTSIAPATATANTATPVTVTGTGLTAAGISISITSTTDATDTMAISDADMTKTDTSITFTYTPAKAGTYNMAVASSDGTALNNQDIVVS